jgi:hypothetical protein
MLLVHSNRLFVPLSLISLLVVLLGWNFRSLSLLLLLVKWVSCVSLLSVLCSLLVATSWWRFGALVSELGAFWIFFYLNFNLAKPTVSCLQKKLFFPCSLWPQTRLRELHFGNIYAHRNYILLNCFPIPLLGLDAV